MAQLPIKQLKARAGKFASRFVFELYLADKHDEIIAEIKRWLESYSVDDIDKLVKDNSFPFVPAGIFQMVGEDVVGFIDYINSKRLWEFLVEARPDLAEAIDSANAYGWFDSMRKHFTACVKDPSSARVQAPVLKDKIVMVHCDSCGNDFPMPKTEAEKLEKCPGCGSPAK